MVLPLILCVIFFILSIIHFNWVFGGTFGFDVSLPTNEKGERVINPKRMESAVVGAGLMTFAFFYLVKSGMIAIDLPDWVMNYVSWIIPLIFILRAIGEFRYIGFFKRIKKTEFGKLDTRFYSPLCLAVGIIGILIELRNGYFN
jgi:hypothetical protein